MSHIFPAFLTRLLPELIGPGGESIGASVVWSRFGRSGSDGALLQNRTRLLEQVLC